MLKYHSKTSVMKGRNIFLLACFCLLFVSIIPQICYAKESFDVETAKINVTIDSDRTYHVTETLNVHFTKPRHGIYRNISLRLNKQNIKISDINVTDADGMPIPYETSFTQSKETLIIGSQYDFAPQNMTYVIHYTLHTYADRNKGFDEVYYRIIDEGWDCYFNQVDFTVSFPKNFTMGQIKFQIESSGTASEAKQLHWEKKEHIITANTKIPLAPNQGLTFNALLPDGYFNQTQPYYLYGTWFVLFLIILLFIFALMLFRMYKADFRDMPKPIVFSPPEDLNPAELGYLVDKKCDNKDITSLIYFWASKGYIRIDQDTYSIKLTRLKYLETGKPYEKTFFYNIFADCDLNGTIDIKKLEGLFYEKIEGAKEQVMKFVNEQINPFDYISKQYFLVIKILSVILLILLLFFTNCTYFPFAFAVSITPVHAAIFGILIFGMQKAQKVFVSNIKRLILFIIMSHGAVCSLIFFFIQLIMTFHPNAYLVIGSLLVSTIFILSGHVFFIYPHAKKLYGDVLGFKNFITTAEKTRLEAMLETNPSYFYKILPYAIALNITDVWTNKFDALSFEPPEWYNSEYDDFTSATYYAACAHSMHHSLARMNDRLCSMPYCSSGDDISDLGSGFFGGFGGGGSSGGGSW